MLFSLAFVYSASYPSAFRKFNSTVFFFSEHAWRIVLGIVMIVIFSKIDYHIWRKISKPLMFLSVFLLFYVLIGGTVINGAKRWIT